MFELAEQAERWVEVAGKDLSAASDADLYAAEKAYAKVRAAVDAGEGRVLAELEARGACDRDFGMGTATWVAHTTHGDRRVVATRVNVATKLRGPLADTGEALARGVITVDHALALSDAANPRILDLIAAEQGEWIARAVRP